MFSYTFLPPAGRMSSVLALGRPLQKSRVPATRRLVKIAKGLTTFGTLLFNDKRLGSVPQDHRVVLGEMAADDLTKVVLPVVNDILLEMEKEDQLLKKQKNLDRYTVYHRFWEREESVEPSVGMILTHNALWRGGDHYDWKFVQVTNVTVNGTVMVKKLKKRYVPDHPYNMSNHFASRRYVEPLPYDASDGEKASALKIDAIYDMWTPERTDYDIYDGGTVN
jgi:hypothetical protein